MIPVTRAENVDLFLYLAAIQFGFGVFRQVGRCSSDCRRWRQCEFVSEGVADIGEGGGRDGSGKGGVGDGDGGGYGGDGKGVIGVSAKT